MEKSFLESLVEITKESRANIKTEEVRFTKREVKRMVKKVTKWMLDAAERGENEIRIEEVGEAEKALLQKVYEDFGFYVWSNEYVLVIRWNLECEK